MVFFAVHVCLYRVENKKQFSFNSFAMITLHEIFNLFPLVFLNSNFNLITGWLYKAKFTGMNNQISWHPICDMHNVHHEEVNMWILLFNKVIKLQFSKV